MEYFEKILFAIVAFVLTSLLAYLFRMRQLYVVAPKLYRHSSISDSGSLCEIIVFNKGNQVEEDISVSFDPDLKIELLASGSGDVEIKDGKIIISRLHKKKFSSAILLVESGVLDSGKIKEISSKHASGRVVKTLEGVPFNYANAFVSSLIFVSFFILLMNIGKLSNFYDEYKEGQMNKEFSTLYSRGWSNLLGYGESDIRKSYSNSEFPIALVEKRDTPKGKGDYIFEVYNKLAMPISVRVDLAGYKRHNAIGEFELSKYYSNVKVLPFEKKELITRNADNVKLDFSIEISGKYIFDIYYGKVKN